MAGTNFPAAAMGYIGGVSIFGQFVRVTSSSITPKQKVNPVQVIDGTVDNTVYSLGPVEIDGSIRLPVMVGGSNVPGGIKFLWESAKKRDLNNGELISKGDIRVEYASGIGRTYSGCLIKNIDFTAEAGGQLECSLEVWGTGYADGATVPPLTDLPTRVLQWSDISISGSDVTGCITKNLKLTLENNLQRNYTFCDESGLFPNNISTGKRMLTGSLGFQGFAPTDGSADTNRNRDTTDATLEITLGKNDPLVITFDKIVWEYQTIEAQVGVLTSSANFYPFASGGGVAFTDNVG